VKLVYFAWVRQKTGISEEDFALPPHVASVRQLAVTLAERGPGFADAFGDLTRLRAAVNQEHVDFDVSIGPDDEIAFFPPVTGG
jgi:molybdopterin synthase sulfur carrier subunit